MNHSRESAAPISLCVRIFMESLLNEMQDGTSYDLSDWFVPAQGFALAHPQLGKNELIMPKSA